MKLSQLMACGTLCVTVACVGGASVLAQSTRSTAKHSEAEVRALQSTKAVVQSILQKENIVPLTSEYFTLEREWFSRRAKWERQFAESGWPLKDVQTEYVNALRTLGNRLMTRTCDAAFWGQIQGKVVLAEADTREALGTTPAAATAATGPAATQPDPRKDNIRDAEKKEILAIEKMLTALNEQLKTRPLTGESLDLRSRWVRRVNFLRLQVTSDEKERLTIGEDYVKSERDFLGAVKKREKVDADRIAIGIAEVGVAEAEVVLEKIKAGQEIREW